MIPLEPPLMCPMKPPSLRWTQECLPLRDSLEIPRISTLISPFPNPLLVLFMLMSSSLMASSCLSSWSHWRWRHMMGHIPFQPRPSLHHMLQNMYCQPPTLAVLPWEDAEDYQNKSFRSTWIFLGPFTGEYVVAELGPELKVLIQECRKGRAGFIHQKHLPEQAQPILLGIGASLVIQRAQFTRQFSIASDPLVCQFLPSFQSHWQDNQYNFGFSDILYNAFFPQENERRLLYTEMRTSKMKNGSDSRGMWKRRNERSEEEHQSLVLCPFLLPPLGW